MMFCFFLYLRSLWWVSTFSGLPKSDVLETVSPLELNRSAVAALCSLLLPLELIPASCQRPPASLLPPPPPPLPDWWRRHRWWLLVGFRQLQLAPSCCCCCCCCCRSALSIEPALEQLPVSPRPPPEVAGSSSSLAVSTILPVTT